MFYIKPAGGSFFGFTSFGYPDLLNPSLVELFKKHVGI